MTENLYEFAKVHLVNSDLPIYGAGIRQEGRVDFLWKNGSKAIKFSTVTHFLTECDLI